MKIILGITGSVAATLTTKLAKALTNDGHEVKIVATKSSLYFIQNEFMFLLPKKELDIDVYTDSYEWPKDNYHKNDKVQHIEFRKWADILLIAPLSANTLAKISYGMCDNFLTCIVRAWEKNKPFLFAPAMNTVMWNDPITETQIDNLRLRFKNMVVINPTSKLLACGDNGIGAMADITDIVGTVNKFKS